MINYDFKQHCTGCNACINICPVDAIKLKEDDNGLKIPIINENKCINCKKCENVCPHLNAKKFLKDINTFMPKTWLYSSSDDNVKMRSASGGAFYELAKKIVEENGYVCGCIWNKNLEAEHIISNNLNEIENMQGSKYVQSDMKNCYKQIIDLLNNGKKVLFSGTPCQCVAMNTYFSNEGKKEFRKNLIIVAIICHGTANPKVLESYKKWLENKYKEKLVNICFRDKSKEGYKKSYCKFTFESGKEIFFPTYLPGSKYIESTLVYNLGLRKSCENCDCKGINQSCDLIIGDWYKANKGKGKLGTSCISAYTEIGEKAVEKYLNNLEIFDFNNILEDNKYIVKSIQLNKNNEEFLKDINNINIWDNVEKFYPPKYKYKKFLIKIGIYDLLKKVIK